MAVRNLIEATPKSVKRFLLTTSAGVDRSNKLPFNILNLFGEPCCPMHAYYCILSNATVSTVKHCCMQDSLSIDRRLRIDIHPLHAQGC